MKYLISMLTLSVGLCANAFAQNVTPGDADGLYGVPYVVPGAAVHTVQSHIVDQLYELRVSLPGDYYAQPDKEYPVVYVLDGQWNFTMLADIGGKLSYDGTVPEFIVAAITWGGEGDDPNLLRGRDFTPTNNPLIPQSGGAAAFLRVIAEELIPYTETLYRANQERVLVGSSLGGLFTSYAMLEQPRLFDGYIALSAPYMLEQAYFEGRLAQLPGGQALDGIKAYFAVGSLDSNQPQVRDFSDQLRAISGDAGLNYQLVEGVGHAGVEPIAYTYGLQHVFQRPQLKLSTRFLKSYAGTYENDAGVPPVTISIHKHKLLLEQEGAQPLEFLAASKTEFYVNGADYNLSFDKAANGDLQFIINVQGAAYKFVRSCSKQKLNF